MPGFEWGPERTARLDAIREDLSQVSTATDFHLLYQNGWRNTFMQGLLPVRTLGTGCRLVGRARTLRYLMRRGPESFPTTDAERAAMLERRRVSPEIVLIESLVPGDVLCVDALGVRTAGVIGDILTTRIKVQGAVAAIVNGVVRDLPFVQEVGLPLFCLGSHPSASNRDIVPVEWDVPIDMAGAQVLPGDVILADDEGAMAIPLELAEYLAANAPAKEQLEVWIRGKIEGGGSIHDYYPPTPEKEAEYFQETGRRARL